MHYFLSLFQYIYNKKMFEKGGYNDSSMRKNNVCVAWKE